MPTPVSRTRDEALIDFLFDAKPNVSKLGPRFHQR